MILHNTNQLNYTPKRIISLVPSQTELLYTLGLQNEVIGITKFCVHPPHWKKEKQIIGGTKNINLKKIAALKPDLIITNKEENVKEQVEELSKYYPTYVTDVCNYDDALEMINDIGHITKKEEKALHLIKNIENEFYQLTQLKNQPLSTCYLIWKDPYMTVGSDTFINSMLQKCGFQNIFETETRYPQITIETIKKLNCQLLLLSTEPYPFKKKHIIELQAELPNSKILLADGEMFSWYGSRLIHCPKYFLKLITNWG